MESESNRNFKWTIRLYAVPNLPFIKQGDDLPMLIYERTPADKFDFRDRDVMVVSQKVVSKAEGAVVRLADVTPTAEAERIARATGRDPRLCQVYIDESSEIQEIKGRMVITRHRLGFICTSAGVDRSNVGPRSEETVTLLPKNPDASARRIRCRLMELTKRELAVIVSDSFGRPDRHGAYGVAIGLAGIRHMEERQKTDLFGASTVTSIALVDELAGAAAAISGETNEGLPVIVIRGVDYTKDDRASILRLLE